MQVTQKNPKKKSTGYVKNILINQNSLFDALILNY